MTAVLPELELDKYTVEQRLQLIERIWNSIPDGEYPVPQWHKDLIKDRIAQREADSGTDTPWQDAMREIQAERRANASSG